MSKDVKSVNYGLEKIFEGADDFLPLLGTDYVEFYVGNAKQSAHFYKTAFGFQSYAYKGLETGSKDSVSYVLKQDKIRLVLTTLINGKVLHKIRYIIERCNYIIVMKYGLQLLNHHLMQILLVVIKQICIVVF